MSTYFIEDYFSFIKNKTIETLIKFLNNIKDFQKFYKINDKDIIKIVNCIKQKHINKSGNNLIIKKNRKGPLFSATCFANIKINFNEVNSNFILPTLDYKLWIVTKKGKSVVWTLLNDYNFSQKYVKSEEYVPIEFIFKKNMLNFYSIENFKKKLYLHSGHLGIGEFGRIHSIKVPIGYYSLYKIDGSLIIMPEKYNIKDIIDKKFILTEYDVEVDAGLFSFINSDVLAYVSEKHIYGDIYFNLLDEKNYSADYVEIYGKNLIKIEQNNEDNKKNIINYIKKNNLEDKLIAFYARNFEGDGIYCTYRCGNIFIICNSNITTILNYFREIYNIYEYKSNKKNLIL